MGSMTLTLVTMFAAHSLLAAPSLNISWAIVLFFTILGLLVTLSPARRTTEIKKPKDD
jgi:hypothetical protein